MKSVLILVTGCLFLLSCNNEKKKDDQKKEDNGKTGMSTGDKKAATEILDLSAADPVRSVYAAFAKDDLDGMTSNFDDNIRYHWSSGDSITGKQAVKEYYAGRWKLIDSISFSNEIVLPIQVNESQQPQVAPGGKWVLIWVMTNAKYKNGKRLVFWQHSVNHFNDAGKIDFVDQYIDRHPIFEATKDLVK